MNFIIVRKAALFIAFGGGFFAFCNGLLMLLRPEYWYQIIPGVSQSGPFNQHFIRDIGFTFLMVGAAYMIGVFKFNRRVFLWAAASVWMIFHASFHGWEIAAGICGTASAIRDLPLVYFPALVGAGLTLWSILDKSKVAVCREN